MRLSWLLHPKGLTAPAIDETVNRECDIDQVFYRAVSHKMCSSGKSVQF